jgi:spoIIIJ-associated protein
MEEDLQKSKEFIEQLLHAMTVAFFDIALHENQEGEKRILQVTITMPDPQMLIGQNGQNLFEFQHLLRIILNKKIFKPADISKAQAFYVDLDINDYKKKKVEYLKNLADQTAYQVVATKEKKILPPMSPYERKVIHDHLASRIDIATQSQGENQNRCVVVTPK